MSVTTYNRQTQGDVQLSPNFKVREFASARDPSPTLKIDSRLVGALQLIREHFGLPVTVASGYRSPAHNKAINGATNSQHMQGTAADIKIRGVTVLDLAMLCEGILKFLKIPGGIGIYGSQTGDTGASGNWVHIDVRATRARWEKTATTGNRQISVFGWTPAPYPKAAQKTIPPQSSPPSLTPAPNSQTRPVLRRGSTGEAVRELQTILIRKGFPLPRSGVDGVFGQETEAAVWAFQAEHARPVDGIVGPVTWAALLM
jgi:hypothetical protein